MMMKCARLICPDRPYFVNFESLAMAGKGLNHSQLRSTTVGVKACSTNYPIIKLMCLVRGTFRLFLFSLYKVYVTPNMRICKVDSAKAHDY